MMIAIEILGTPFLYLFEFLETVTGVNALWPLLASGFLAVIFSTKRSLKLFGLGLILGFSLLFTFFMNFGCGFGGGLECTFVPMFGFASALLAAYNILALFNEKTTFLDLFDKTQILFTIFYFITFVIFILSSHW